MQFEVLSDIHLDSNGFHLNNPLESTVLLLAGDLACLNSSISEQQIIAFLQRANLVYEKVIYVLGNHEFYNGSLLTGPHQVNALIKSHQLDNVICLEDETFQIGNTVIIGSTFWTNYTNAPSLDLIKYSVNDFRYIYTSDIYKTNDLQKITNDISPFCKRTINFTDIKTKHQNSINFIDSEIKKAHQNKLKSVVITHHAPSYRSVSPKFKGNPINPAFVSDYDEFIKNAAPNFWIHGHVHSNWDYMIGSTRVLCNPRGYRNESDVNFINGKYFTIDP